MLKYQWIKTHKEKKTLLETFDTDKGLWIVSHWQAKRYLEDFYIRSQKNLIGNPFKTSSEFWEERWLCEYPETPIISAKFTPKIVGILTSFFLTWTDSTTRT